MLAIGGRLDDSFLLVAGSASMLRQGGAQGGMQASTQGIPVHAMDEKLLQIARTFEIASGETQVPADCLREVARH